MKLKMPMMSVEARGTVGGITYNTWKGINYCKTCTSPTGQGTKKRLDAQGLLITVAKLWETIGDPARAAWNAYAASHPVTSWTGPPMHLTGMNWFVKCHVTLRRMNFNYLVAAPTTAAPNPIVGMDFAHITTYLQLSWSAPNTGLNRVEMRMVGPQSAGIQAKYEKSAFFQQNSVLDAPGVILVNSPGIGRWTIWARIVDNANGLTSSWLSAYVDVV